MPILSNNTGQQNLIPCTVVLILHAEPQVSKMESRLAPQFSYRLAVPDDQTGILKVFEEVASEVPTRVYDDTAARIAEDIALGESWIALDEDGIIVGYALAGTNDGELTLAYLGVSKSARDQKVNSTLIAKLKDRGAPINTEVRTNNKSSMVERFERMGFVRRNEDPFNPFDKDRTKLRWEKKGA